MTPEVLSPAGDLECLKTALLYGADAVYLARREFGMRSAPKNFSYEELCEACGLAHSAGKKIYLACNTLPRNRELSGLKVFADEASSAGVDAFIVSDIGVMSLLKEYAPDIDIHISTQAGVVNFASAREFYRMGAKRAVLARELSLDEIKQIRDNTPPELELEAFVHGAMCVSFSGRCLLSQYLTDRDANRGECAQPCRWSYALMEMTREGQYFPVEESDGGTYILNAKDMCMIEHLGELASAGISSFKIEGRAKSPYYVATVTNAYRAAVDSLAFGSLPEWIKDETEKVSHREYCTGFYFGSDEIMQNTKDGGYVRGYDFAGTVEGSDGEFAEILQRSRFFRGDTLEAAIPRGRPVCFTVERIIDKNGEESESANRAAEHYRISCPIKLEPGTVLRVKKYQGGV